MKVLCSCLWVMFCILPCLCGDHPDGESEVHRSQDALGNYRFSYSVANNEGEHFREEGTDALGRVVGSYGLKHVDGTHRVVDYIADKGGFRAAIRTNEPGVISSESADATILKADPNAPLTVAATSDDQSRQVFGRRIDAGVSKVSYVDEDNEAKRENDESVRESRQRNFDDYRPLSPVAYYPTDRIRSPVSPSDNKPVDPVRSPRVLTQNSEADSKPVDVYFPPIDPHTAIRRPPYYLPRDRSTEGNFYPTSTSRKPYIPPYGGFDDDDLPPPPTDRRPGVAIHRDLGPILPISTPSPISSQGARRFPPSLHPENRNFDLPRFPPSSNYPSPPNSALPNFPTDHRNIPPETLYNPPSYDGRIGNPNFVLRAVPIPNGIQAVKVDPSTGRVYERLVYPLFIRHDGQPDYDRNILLHNDDVSDEGSIRYGDPGYLDMPYRRPPYRGARNQPTDNEDGNRYGNRQYNRSYNIDEHSLSEPSAADVDWVKKQLALVEGFNGDQFFNKLLSQRFSDHDSNFPGNDHFDDEDRQQYDRRIPGSRIRATSDLIRGSSEEELARETRSKDDLASESSKTIFSKVLPEDGSQILEDVKKSIN
uniref:Cuticle protein 14 isoform a n=1 Tax=Parasteatoda tepidariorum TaxID=114398 RepID=A0A2L2Y6W5_PARTP